MKSLRYYKWLMCLLLFFPGFLTSCSSRFNKKVPEFISKLDSIINQDDPDWYNPVNAMMVLPANPVSGERFRILTTGGKSLRNAKIIIDGAASNVQSHLHKEGEELPYWRIDIFEGCAEGVHKAVLFLDNREIHQLEFVISKNEGNSFINKSRNTSRSWDAGIETIYSAWINALFQGCGEESSWPALHEVTRDKERNFLYNYLSSGEDDPKSGLVMEPDCADNPFFLRAYFAWKLGLPFGYHQCDHGYQGGRSPRPGQWITNKDLSSMQNPVKSFNYFLALMKNGVHSGTARTALNDENSDYYPVTMDRQGLRPGTVYADPYGHTLILVSWVPQTKSHPGKLLSVDAQPDKTIAIKRFWKGNFLFNTSEVIGEPGFKAFRPIVTKDGRLSCLSNESLNASSGFSPFSLQQRKMDSKDFYQIMERIINPRPLNPEEALTELINALHEQLKVRVKSISNGEAYFKMNSGTVIPMPSSANGIFLTGGRWEDFSTPNRDLRLLIAIDAVLDFPERVARSKQDFRISGGDSEEDIKNKLQSFLEQRVAGLKISYPRSDGSLQELTLTEILKRRDAFEMAYNPNDGAEIRWGAPEKSEERSTCRRFAPSYQHQIMQSVRHWFHKRQHPPT